MQIEKLVVGELQENCYICTLGNFSFIVDPGSCADDIIDACKGKNVVEILVTHYHFDHVGALDEVKKYFNLEENVRSGKLNYEIIDTPGHTSDSKCFYFKDEKVIFSGDFLFCHSIGRCDLPTGSTFDMVKSLELISSYPDDLVVYPGHGISTSLGKEKKLFHYYF